MAKATVLQCDLCMVWDSEEVAVRTVNVAGPRFDLCAPCRIEKIMDMGVSAVKAHAYVEMYDQRATVRGATLSLNAQVVKDRVTLMEAAGTGPAENPDQEKLHLVLADDQGEPTDGDPKDQEPLSGPPDGQGDVDKSGADYADQVLADLAAEAQTDTTEPATSGGQKRSRARSGK